MRFQKEDMTKFGIYAGVLFILVCILESNLISFYNDGTFVGLNFFMALSSKYILFF